MSKRISEFTESLRQLGEIQVTDWDFAEILNREIQFGASLRKLGSIRVNDWDFGAVMPAVHKLAHQEVELPDLVKRAADFKIMDWDFRSRSAPVKSLEPEGRGLDSEERQRLIAQLRGFLQFLVASLVKETDRTSVRVEEVQPGVVRFHVVVAQSDVKDLIGRDGATASAIRNLLKSKALSEGLNALLEIKSHEEELAQSRS